MRRDINYGGVSESSRRGGGAGRRDGRIPSWPPRTPLDDMGAPNGCNDAGESSHCRSRVRLLMEKGNLIPQSLQIQSRVRLHFGSYPVKKGGEGGRGKGRDGLQTRDSPRP